MAVLSHGMMDGAYATKVDRSRESGTLVVCTCGLAIGPVQDHVRAVQIATAHRRLHQVNGGAPLGGNGADS